MAKYTQKQSAIVHFDGYEFAVRIAPPGDEADAIAAAANVARTTGYGDVASRMTYNRSRCWVEWGPVQPTEAYLKEIRITAKPTKPIPPPPPPRPKKIVFPQSKISQQEVNQKNRGL